MSGVSLSPSQRAWQRFQRNRLGYWSLLIFCTLFVLSLGAELISNDKPLLARYDGQLVLPHRQQRAGDHLWRRFPDADRLPRPLHPAAVRQARQLGALSAQPLPLQHHQLLRQGAQPLGALGRQLAGHRRPRARRGGAPALRFPHLGAVRAGADPHRRAAGRDHRRRAGLLRRQDRPAVPALHRDLGLHARALPADHLLRHVRPQRGPAADPAQPVRLDGPVRLRARRIPAQPPARLRARGARHGPVATGRSSGATSCPTA